MIQSPGRTQSWLGCTASTATNIRITPVQLLVAFGSEQFFVEHNLEHSGIVAFGHKLYQIQLARIDSLEVSV